MNKNRIVLFLSILISIFLISGCNKNNQSEDVVNDGLVINSISIGLGGELNKTLVTYNINIWNKTRKTILIKSVEPILPEDLKQRLTDDRIINDKNKMVNGTSGEIITGSFYLNTQGLDKQGIEALNIKFDKFRIITEQEIGLETH
ncbi:hypothetical protein [Paenibacillus fonticola]|uniref:hypothetical protein n=1 Tax=Paenibacillus fonticola TaxID=379896 RepID=UPI0003706987|nr:hypothetical protein [Paenibacillus fonticola]